MKIGEGLLVGHRTRYDRFDRGKRLPRDLEATFASNKLAAMENSVRLGFQFRPIA